MAYIADEDIYEYEAGGPLPVDTFMALRNAGYTFPELERTNDALDPNEVNEYE